MDSAQTDHVLRTLRAVDNLDKDLVYALDTYLKTKSETDLAVLEAIIVHNHILIERVRKAVERKTPIKTRAQNLYYKFKNKL